MEEIAISLDEVDRPFTDEKGIDCNLRLKIKEQSRYVDENSHCNAMAEDRGDGVKTEVYPKLIQFGLDEEVAAKLDDIYKAGKLVHTELDERALDALKEFPVDGALNVLGQFLESNLEHVSNKSAYLCGIMKTYRLVFIMSRNKLNLK